MSNCMLYCFTAVVSDRFDEPTVGNYSVNSSKHASFESDLPGKAALLILQYLMHNTSN